MENAWIKFNSVIHFTFKLDIFRTDRPLLGICAEDLPILKFITSMNSSFTKLIKYLFHGASGSFYLSCDLARSTDHCDPFKYSLGERCELRIFLFLIHFHFQFIIFKENINADSK